MDRCSGAIGFGLVLALMWLLAGCGGGGGDDGGSGERSSYRLTYDGNANTSGGVPIDNNRYLTGEEVSVLDNTGGLARTGYNFIGWNTREDGHGSTYRPTESFIMGATDVTLYARWAPTDFTYLVSYNGNGNTGGDPPDSGRYLNGREVKVPGNPGNLTRAGYHFVGWNARADGTGTNYTQEQTFVMGLSDVTLYARWSSNPVYTVTYDGNGNTGGEVPVDTTGYENGTEFVVLNDVGILSKPGYSVIGWNNQADGSGADYAPGQRVTMGGSDMTLYAQWGANTSGAVWLAGSDTAGQSGSYGTLGIAAESNTPGGRQGPAAWSDESGNLWLIGGWGYDAGGVGGYLNDLWRYDGVNWTWVAGSDVFNQPGNYGTRGVADPANAPGGRVYAGSWIDGEGNLWLFGGQGVAGQLNDLWKYDGANWTWVGGSDSANGAGCYSVGECGTLYPGAREKAVVWLEVGGNAFWLYGGYGHDSQGDTGLLNDLWRYEIDQGTWSWQGGGDRVTQNGVYTGESPYPGARMHAVGWRDSAGDLWLFGGQGLGHGRQGRLNDLWKYDVTASTWHWVSGSWDTEESGVYGLRGIADRSNRPGARDGSVAWVDIAGNLWLGSGSGFDAFGNYGQLNDLWRFNVADNRWTWVAGSAGADTSGSYGTQGVFDSANIPGARSFAASGTDGAGNLLIFGGHGFDGSGDKGRLNDLWRYRP